MVTYIITWVLLVAFYASATMTLYRLRWYAQGYGKETWAQVVKWTIIVLMIIATVFMLALVSIYPVYM